MENQVKLFGLYHNNNSKDTYRVVNILDGYVYYVPSTKSVVYRRPIKEWFGKNRNGDVRFAEVTDSNQIPIIDTNKGVMRI